MRHLGGYFHRNLHQTAYLVPGPPSRLIDHLADSLFLDGVGVRTALGRQAADDFARPLAVAVEEVFADHVAVDEETVRLRSHIAQLRQMLESGSPVGRKADFLIQEFNREANTIGSKCQNADIAKVVVDLKSEIEKIREQIQNIE